MAAVVLMEIEEILAACCFFFNEIYLLILKKWLIDIKVVTSLATAVYIYHELYGEGKNHV